MIACEPKDNKLSTPPRSGSPGTQSTDGSSNLKVGSYGLTILAAQQIEKMGALTQYCLQTIQNGEIQGAQVGQLVRFRCLITQDQEQLQGASTQIINDEWSLQVNFNQETSRFDLSEVILVEAKRSKGFVISKFKNNVLKTTLNSDRFSMTRVNDQLEFKISQNFEINSNQTINYFTFHSIGTISDKSDEWTVNFDSVYQYVNQSKSFPVQSTNLTLQWKNRFCADYTGEATVQDGSVFATIRLQSDTARLVTDKRPWQQKLVPCTAREFSFQNFDFIFY